MKRVARFGLLLLAVASVQGKTTDQLIDEVEDLLGKAPAVDAKSPAVVTKVESLVSAKTASLPLQQAGSAAMRFAQAQVGSAKEPLSPFSGAAVNLAQRKQEDTFVAGLQGSQLMQSVMAGRSIAPQQQIPQQQMPMQGMPPQMPMQGMPQQMPMQGMPQQMPMQGMPPQMPVQGMPQQMPTQGMSEQMPGMPQQMPMPAQGRTPGPPARPAWTPPPTTQGAGSAAPVNGVPAPMSMLEIRTKSTLRNGRVDAERVEAGASVAAAESAAVEEAAFGYNRVSPNAPSSFGMPAFGERSNRNPAPIVDAPKAAPKGYSKVNEIAKAMAWEASHKAGAKAAAKAAMAAPSALPRFREIAPQKAPEISPFYAAHMVSNKNDVNVGAVAELEKIPDVSSSSDSSTEKHRFLATELVQHLPGLKEAAATDATSKSKAVEPPQYDNSKPALDKKLPAHVDVASVSAAPTKPKAAAPHVPHPHRHTHPLGLRRTATSLMRFNRIQAGKFHPSVGKVVWHDWVGKSKERVKKRILGSLRGFDQRL